MRISFYTTSPPPALPGTDAVYNEVNRLRTSVQGWQTCLYPFQKPGLVHGRRWYGMQRLFRVMGIDAQCDAHHLFAGEPMACEVLRFVRRPVVVTLAAGLSNEVTVDPHMRKQHLIVASHRDFDVLHRAGAPRVHIIRPGIPVDHIDVAPELTAPFTLMCATAPWRDEQLIQKGFEAMLNAASVIHDLHLVLVLRGYCGDALRRRIATHGLQSRVEVIDGLVNINHLLQRCHAAFALAATPNLIRAYPHSLLEAIAAGRPALISQCIPMSDDVKKKSFGQVCNDLSLEALCSAIARLRECHEAHRKACLLHGRAFADENNSVRAHHALYAQLAGAGK